MVPDTSKMIHRGSAAQHTSLTLRLPGLSPMPIIVSSTRVAFVRTQI